MRKGGLNVDGKPNRVCILSWEMVMHRLRVEWEAMDQLSASVFKLLVMDKMASVSPSPSLSLPDSRDIEMIAAELRSLVQPCPDGPTLVAGQEASKSSYTWRAIRVLESIHNDICGVVKDAPPEEMCQVSCTFHDRLDAVRHDVLTVKALKDGIKEELDDFDSKIPLMTSTKALPTYDTGECSN